MKYKKYVFYDIECANCRNYTAKISTFGYVITDEKFNILVSKEIKINPEAPFYSFEKVDGKEIRKIYIPDDIDTYLSAPIYKNVYNEIRNLFSMKDALYIGFGNVSDAYYLYESNKRYGMNDFDYSFIDVKDIFNWRYSDRKFRMYKGLDKVASFFNIECTQIHNALADAMTTFKVCKALARKCKNIELIDIAKLSHSIYNAKESKVFKDKIEVCKIIYPDMKLPD